METEQKENITETETPGLGQSELVLMIRGFYLSVVKNRILALTLKYTAIFMTSVFAVLFFLSIFVYIVPAIQDAPLKSKFPQIKSTEVRTDDPYKKEISALQREVLRNERKFASYTPGQSYLVINTTDNTFNLFKGRTLVRSGFCSSGSYTRLVTPEGNREWIFKTPKGQFTIQQKIVKPLWVKPDWAFVEEGLPIPSAEDESRFEFGVLGDYAMALGDGYLIHGTIYKRFLGMPVTHGCVRLNDDDLEAIFNAMYIGSKVFIF